MMPLPLLIGAPRTTTSRSAHEVKQDDGVLAIEYNIGDWLLTFTTHC